MKEERVAFKDDFVRSVFKNVDQKVLPNTFEIRLMTKINSINTYKQEVSAKLKKSMVYLFVGVFLIGFCSLCLIFFRAFFSDLSPTAPILFLFFSIVSSIVFIINYRRFFHLLNQ